MNKKPIVEIIFGVILLLSIAGYYYYCSNHGASEVDIGETSEVQLIDDSDGVVDANESNEYYSGLKIISQDKFLEQQCVGMNQSVTFAAQKFNENGYTPVSVKVTGVSICEDLTEEELERVQTHVGEFHEDADNWNCFLFDRTDISSGRKSITREEMEAVSSYVFVDIELTNPNEVDVYLDLKQALLLTIVNDDGTLDAQFYDDVGTMDYISTAYGGNNSVLISTDQPVDYVGKSEQVQAGRSALYRESDRNQAMLKNCIFIDGTLHLRMLYVVSEHELDTGKVSLSSASGNTEQSGKFDTTGFRIDLRKEITKPNCLLYLRVEESWHVFHLSSICCSVCAFFQSCFLLPLRNYFLCRLALC